MTTTSLTVPLTKIAVAPENPRAGSKPVNVESLAANIGKYGLLRSLFVYEEKGKYFAFAGSRRLAALQHLAKFANPDTPQAVKDLLAAVPVEVYAKEDIPALALADNESEAMTIPETVRAWAKMIADGADAKEVANAFGVTEHRVKQRIALANLHKPIFEAFEANKIDMEVARLYANAPAERQASVWKSVGPKAYAYKVREALTKGKLSATDPIAKFVGKEAYVAAGGTIEADLFTDSRREEDAHKPGGTFWTNRDLAENLAQQKLDAAVEKAKADGWGFAVIKTDNWYNSHDYAENPKSKGDQLKRDRGKLGQMISIDHNGKLSIDTVTKKGSSKGGKAAAKGAKASGKAGPGTKPAPQPPMTNTTHELLTRTAGAIVGRTLAEHPQAAIAVLIAHMARERWGDDKTSNRADYATSAILNLTSHNDWRNEKNARRSPMKRDREWETLDEEWRAALGDLNAIEATVETWTDHRRSQALAYLVGELVAVTENHVSSNPKIRRSRLAAIGGLMKTQPADHWTPDETFLMGYSRTELAKVAKELGVEEGKTKKATATAVAIAAADKRWVPPLMRTLTGAAASTIAAKPAAKSSGKALKGKTATNMRKEAIKKSKAASAREAALT